MNERKKKRKLTFEQRLIIAVVISLLLHLLFLLLYAFPFYILFPNLDFFKPDPKPVQEEKDEKDERLVFELVETPDDADQTTKPKDTKFVSDKNAVARDMYAAKDKPQGDPFAPGDFDVNNYLLNQLENQLERPQQPPPVPPDENPQKQDEQQKEQENTEDDTKNESDLKIKQRRFVSAKEDFRRAAFLSQFEAASDKRPVRRDQAQRKQEETNSNNLGGFTLNTYAWEWAPYLQEMKDKIDRNLFPPQAFTKMGVIDGESLIRFKVYPDGHVEDIEILNYEGHRSLMETSVNSIKGAEPFLPLPTDFPRDKGFLQVTAHFQYFIQGRQD